MRFLPAALLLLGACAADGPELSPDEQTRGVALLAEARAAPPPRPLSESAAAARFARVSARIVPPAQALCRETHGDAAFCAARPAIDTTSHARATTISLPEIRISQRLLRETGSDAELAFLLAHDYGHLIGRHARKQAQGSAGGALVGAALAIAVSPSSDGWRAVNGLDAFADGTARPTPDVQPRWAEREADQIAVRILAAAGYDAGAGARISARHEPTLGDAYWRIHPGSAERLAAIAAAQQPQTTVP